MGANVSESTTLRSNYAVATVDKSDKVLDARSRLPVLSAIDGQLGTQPFLHSALVK